MSTVDIHSLFSFQHKSVHIGKEGKRYENGEEKNVKGKEEKTIYKRKKFKGKNKYNQGKIKSKKVWGVYILAYRGKEKNGVFEGGGGVGFGPIYRSLF